jgi:Ran GTPase-activating protein (RanGAP) involved in mRNA processing and transport
MASGMKWFAKGLKINNTLEILNLKGNVIGDEGCVYLSKAIRNNRTLRDLDISMNEIGPIGFKSLVDALPES